MAVDSPVGNDLLLQVSPDALSSTSPIGRMIGMAIADEDAKNDPASLITQHTLLTIGPFFRAVAILAGLIGRLEVTLQKKEKGNRNVVQTDDDRNFLVGKKPHQHLKSRTWRQQTQVHAMLTPGGFSEIIRNPTNPKKILAIMPLDPNRMSYGIIKPVRGEFKGQEKAVYFYWDNPKSLEARPIDFDDVIHIKGLSYNGVMAMDPVNMMRQDMGLATSRRGYAKAYFHSNGQIRGFMEVPPTVSPEKFVNFMAIVQTLAAERGADPTKTIPLFDGIKFIPFQDTPDKSQLRESLEMTPEIVSHWTGVPEMLLGRVKESSYNTLEQVMRGFFFTTVDNWLDEYEDEYDDKLLSDEELRAGNIGFKFDRSQLNKLLVEEYHKMIREDFHAGLASWEESREALDRHTDPTEGHFFLPQNLVGRDPIQLGGDPTAPRQNSGRNSGPNQRGNNPRTRRAGRETRETRETPAQTGPTNLAPAQNPAQALVLRRNANQTLGRICNRLTKAITHAADKPDFQKQLMAIAERESPKVAEELEMLNDLSIASGLIRKPVACDLIDTFSTNLLTASGTDSIQAACQSATQSILTHTIDQLLGVS